MSEAYEVEITEEAEDDLAAIDRHQAKLILEKIFWLAANAEELSHTRLKGKKWAGLSRHTAGNYRIIYKVDHNKKLIIVNTIGHRRDVYDE